MSRNNDDAHYFAERAKEERRRAQSATQTVVQSIHLELAQMYEQKKDFRLPLVSLQTAT